MLRFKIVLVISSFSFFLTQVACTKKNTEELESKNSEADAHIKNAITQKANVTHHSETPKQEAALPKARVNTSSPLDTYFSLPFGIPMTDEQKILAGRLRTQYGPAIEKQQQVLSSVYSSENEQRRMKAIADSNKAGLRGGQQLKYIDETAPMSAENKAKVQAAQAEINRIAGMVREQLKTTYSPKQLDAYESGMQKAQQSANIK